MVNELNIVFLGGSITWGAGAESYENSWAYQTEQFLKNRLAGRKLNFYNVAISGTGSRVGVFRLSSQVLELKPDLIFIEFAVNDSSDAAKDEEQVIAAMEYIVRRLILHNPNIKIIFLYSAMQTFNACAQTHQKVASYYKIPSIDIQSVVKDLILTNRRQWNDLFVDAVHPSISGHALYFDIIQKELSENWGEIFSKNIILSPEPLVPPVYSFPTIVNYDSYIWPDSWQSVTVRDCKHIDVANVKHAICSDKKGASFETSFFGRHFGLYHYVGSNGGMLKISIDDSPYEVLDCYYNCAGEYVSFYNKTDLADHLHTLKLEIDENANPKSTGNHIGIAGFLID